MQVPVIQKLVSPDQYYVVKFNELAAAFELYVGMAVPITGEIRKFSGSATPAGWLVCDGGAHTEATFPDLFGVIGHSYGYDVAGTFRVPHFQPHSPSGAQLGGIEVGDVFTAHLPGDVDATFIAQNSSEEDVAAGLCAVITASAGYADQVFTASYSAVSTTIYLTAKTPGQAFSGVSLTTATAPVYLLITSPVAAVAQVSTITIGGVVEAGDSYTAHLPGVDATYIAAGGDQVAAGLSAAIHASGGYAGQAFTAAVVNDQVILTAKAAGVGFSCTCSANNGGADGTQSATIATTVANVVAVAQVDAVEISPVKAKAWPGVVYIIKT